jgi:FkbM family methyltransferase
MTDTVLHSQPENILTQNPDKLVEAQNLAFAGIISETGLRFVLFGAGALGQKTLEGCRKAGIEPLAFADNNQNLWGSKIGGLQVLSPQSAAEKFRTNAIFVITVYTSSPVWGQLRPMGLKITSFAALAWEYSQSLLPYWAIEYPNKIFEKADDIRNAFTLWEDELSRREYVELLKWFTRLDSFTQPAYLQKKDIYFPDELYSPLSNENFVDCGAFDGDSVSKFVDRRKGSFGKIIAIEPDPGNWQALLSRVSSFPQEIQNRIRLIQKAVGSTRGMVNFNAKGSVSSSIGSGNSQVICTPLDDILTAADPTFIKMDIEGVEYDALIGARLVITNYTPILAICLYHSMEDLWRIPLLIRSYSDQYAFYLRRYSDECWETVCYAIPRIRMISSSAGEK